MLLRTLIFVLLVVLLVGLALSLLRRAPKRPAVPKAARTQEPTPADAAGTSALGRDEVLRRLRALALGTAPEALESGGPDARDEAVAAALEEAANEPRYAPRRPLLLPRLLKAASDDGSSRKDLADIIGQDPALVGNLLKLANGPYYRTSSAPIESIDRAVAVLGTQGIRSLAAAALVQPVFRAQSKESGRFADVAWEHTVRSAAAAEAFAFAVEGADPFAAQLLALVTGLASIVVFRAASDIYAERGLRAEPRALAALLEKHTARVARQVASTWELSDRLLEALDEQLPGRPARPASPLGRSLRFGVVAGALSVLASNAAIDGDTARASFTAAGGVGKRLERLLEKLSASAAADASA